MLLAYAPMNALNNALKNALENALKNALVDATRARGLRSPRDVLTSTIETRMALALRERFAPRHT